MRTWKRFSFVSFLLALLITGAGYLAWKMYFAKFKAQARLYVAAQQPKILFQTVEAQESDVDAYKRFQSVQQTLVKSRLVLNAALRDSKVSQYPMIKAQVDPVAWLQENLNVEFVAGSEVMEISLSGSNPEEVAGIVNAITTAYLDEVVNKDAKLRVDRHDKLRKIREDYENKLRERRDNLNRVAVQGPNRETIKEDIAQMEDSAQKIGAQVEVLNVELQAPPRIRIIDLAVPHRP